MRERFRHLLQRTPPYCLVMILLGLVFSLLGLAGIYGASLAEQLFADRLPVMSVHIQPMRIEGLSTAILGMVLFAWGLDRQIASANWTAQPEPKSGAWRNSLLGIFLVALTAVMALNLRGIVPEWVRYIRLRTGIKTVTELRSTLILKGLPAKGVHLGSKGGRFYAIIVELEGPNIKDVHGLVDLPINHLILRDTCVRDLTPLKTCSLRNLALQGTLVEAISPLAGTDIEILDLRGSKVQDLRPLTQMPRLKSILLLREQIERNLSLLSSLNVTVQIEDGGPAWSTQGSGWIAEFGKHSPTGDFRISQRANGIPAVVKSSRRLRM